VLGSTTGHSFFCCSTKVWKLTRHEGLVMGAALADPEARSFLRSADPVPAQVIDAQPDFHPRAWLDQLPPLTGRTRTAGTRRDGGLQD
jgi:hypothetical protein